MQAAHPREFLAVEATLASSLVRVTLPGVVLNESSPPVRLLHEALEALAMAVWICRPHEETRGGIAMDTVRAWAWGHTHGATRKALARLGEFIIHNNAASRQLSSAPIFPASVPVVRASNLVGPANAEDLQSVSLLQPTLPQPAAVAASAARTLAAAAATLVRAPLGRGGEALESGCGSPVHDQRADVTLGRGGAPLEGGGGLGGGELPVHDSLAGAPLGAAKAAIECGETEAASVARALAAAAATLDDVPLVQCFYGLCQDI